MSSNTFKPVSIRDDYSYYGTSSSYPLSNMYGNGTEGSKYAGININREANSDSYIFIQFDFSSIPENVTILNVTAAAKIYGSSTAQSRTSVREIQMYSGSTPKGEASSYSLSGSSVISNIDDCGTWTRNELDDAALRIYAKHSSSTVSANTYIYVMGAEVTVEYAEASTVKHKVTVSTGTGITVDHDVSEDVYEGSKYELTINGDVYSITDNGVDVKGQLTNSLVYTEESVTKYPSGYTTNGNISGTRYTNAVGKSSSTTATGNDYSNSSSSNATIMYSFDFSDIPENATINSVTVTVGGHCESTSQSSEVAKLQLYSGSSKKGNEVSFTSTSKQVITMTPGTWTRDELQEAKLYFTIGYYGGLVNGADFIVDYSVANSGGDAKVYTINSVNEDHAILINITGDTKTLYFKKDGEWVLVKNLLRKSSNKWDSQDFSIIQDTEIKQSSKIHIV